MRTARVGLACAMTVALIALGAQRTIVADLPAPAPAPTPAHPQDAKQADGQASADLKGVRDLVDSFVKAYNAKDAKAIAAQFAADGRIIGTDGSITEGRDAIEARYRDAFEDAPDARIEVNSESIRTVAPDVAVEQGRATFRSGDNRSQGGKYHAYYVRKDGRWLQSCVYEIADDSAKTLPADHLRELDWLIGEWIDEGDVEVAHTNCHWDESKAFLIRDFDLKIAGRTALTGTQRIGWDPSTEQFRSWVFDSEGGFSEGHWTRDGDRWLIKNEGYVPDGRTVTATNILSREGKDRMRWATTQGTLGSEAVEEDAEVVLVRKPPKPR